MNPLHILLTLSSSSLLLACTSWPEEGEGGFAEYHTDQLISVEHQQQITSKHGLRFDYSLLKNQLALLELQGATYCFPAAVDDAQKLEKRIIRELSGQLYGSAESSIIKQRLALTTLEIKLKEVINDFSCKPPIDNKEGNIASLLNILNSDNQFAINSSEVNKKYKDNLNHAAKQLLKLSQYRILIVGHTDESGHEQHNLSLSYERARSVQDLLVTAGINPKAIDILASGEQSPSYKGQSEATQLINRNVRIYLIEG
ncbi:OmpA family protein [Agaribacterium sp. ZY112]|uniref:OmpA family protein n=1 Tax=Agaribacterium sp. ZY112 TaxID=3233574 RepID=UPI003523B9CD